MFRLTQIPRKIIAVLMAGLLLWTLSAEAWSDWIEHERSHDAAFAAPADEDHSQPGQLPAHECHCCHACHHLQLYAASIAGLPTIPAALPKPAPLTAAMDDSAPNLLYHPPRPATPA
jgi:hypothetical protein